MGGLTSAVQWWEESQLRLLLAYHGGDAVAIYGLATLFNRHKGDEATSSNKALEVAWAPILLIHLGGCDGVTAYNIEDNELWTRHLLTAVSQVTVAIYVFSKSWPFAGGDKRISNSYESSSKVWPEIVPQYSLAGYFVRNRKHSNVMRIVSLLGCKDFLDQHWCMKPCFSSARIIELVHQYLKDGWKGRIQGPASYRSFNNHSNHWGLNMNRPFDECVLLWHLATDFCFFLSSFPEHASDKNQTTSQCRQKGWAMNQTQFLDPFISRQMSNYMVYLLFVNPEMLLPGTRRNLFDTAHNDLKATLSGWEWNPACSSRWTPKEIKPLVEEETVMHGLIKVMQEKSEKMTCQEESLREAYTVITIKQEKLEESNKEGNFIDQAWALAQRLTKMGEKKMWDQIQDVWVQMLCFSASRGRGYLHAKALGKGGEFLSYVWFLLFLMGMETLSERLQRDLLPSSQGNNGTAAPPSAFEVSTIGTAPMASEVSTIRFRAPHHDRRHSVDF
nr:unnamed protein product [Digitaria exilis]